MSDRGLDLINSSGIWSELGKIIVGEMCLKDLRNVENLRHVPKLEEDSDEFYPLKTVRDIHTNHQIQYLGKRQTKFVKESVERRHSHLSNGLLRKSREIRDVQVAQICEERILEEVVHPAEFHPCLRIFQSVNHSSQPSSTRDRGLTREVTISVENIEVRRIDPRELLWCRLDPGNGHKSCLVRLIYEAHIAEKLSFTFNVSCHPGDRDLPEQEEGAFHITIKNCALAYRFVDLELSKEGLVIDIHFRPVPGPEQKSRLSDKFFKGLKERLSERLHPRLDGSSESLSECNETCVLLPSLLSRNEKIMKILNIHQVKLPSRS
ncbi:hypothetical protein HOLleu_05365 [Holothuria leucospilota]|uniref:Uncharacterized protein n=1 Tax=Holothuria leucospilota TaxID=206669 RepID=A0A9Q1CJY6_HOLLE|nr:hypothetical protein HOLleu_05365 [Holothuria leucospilota]